MGNIKRYFLSADELEKRRQERREKGLPVPEKKKLSEITKMSQGRYEQFKAEGITDETLIREMDWLTKDKLKLMKEKWYG